MEPVNSLAKDGFQFQWECKSSTGGELIPFQKTLLLTQNLAVSERLPLLSPSTAVWKDTRQGTSTVTKTLPKWWWLNPWSWVWQHTTDSSISGRSAGTQYEEEKAWKALYFKVLWTCPTKILFPVVMHFRFQLSQAEFIFLLFENILSYLHLKANQSF